LLYIVFFFFFFFFFPFFFFFWVFFFFFCLPIRRIISFFLPLLIISHGAGTSFVFTNSEGWATFFPDLDGVGASSITSLFPPLFLQYGRNELVPIKWLPSHGKDPLFLTFCSPSQLFSHPAPEGSGASAVCCNHLLSVTQRKVVFSFLGLGGLAIFFFPPPLRTVRTLSYSCSPSKSDLSNRRKYFVFHDEAPFLFPFQPHFNLIFPPPRTITSVNSEPFRPWCNELCRWRPYPFSYKVVAFSRSTQGNVG